MCRIRTCGGTCTIDPTWLCSGQPSRCCLGDDVVRFQLPSLDQNQCESIKAAPDPGCCQEAELKERMFEPAGRPRAKAFDNTVIVASQHRLADPTSRTDRDIRPAVRFRLAARGKSLSKVNLTPACIARSV